MEFLCGYFAVLVLSLAFTLMPFLLALIFTRLTFSGGAWTISPKTFFSSSIEIKGSSCFFTGFIIALFGGVNHNGAINSS